MKKYIVLLFILAVACKGRVPNGAVAPEQESQTEWRGSTRFEQQVEDVAARAGIGRLAASCNKEPSGSIRVWGGFSSFSPTIQGWIFNSGNVEAVTVANARAHGLPLGRGSGSEVNGIYVRRRVVDMTKLKDWREAFIGEISQPCAVSRGADSVVWYVQLCHSGKVVSREFSPNCDAGSLLQALQDLLPNEARL